MVDVLLLHGTTQGPAGWDKLRQSLAERSITTAAPELPADQPDLSASEYADVIRESLLGQGAEMTVAHSGSGILLPAVARAIRSSHAVWLAAYVPRSGLSLLDEMRNGGELFHPDWPGTDPTQDHAAARRFLFHDCPPDVQSWALRTLRTFVPRRAYEDAADDPLDCGAELAVVVCERDRTLRPDWLREAGRARLRTEPLSVDAGHCPHVSRPDEIAALLTDLLHRDDGRCRG